MRSDATGCPLRAETLLAALCEASSPIHEDRNGLPQLTERMEVSRLPPSYRHAGVRLGTILPRRARVRRGFLFPIALSDLYLCTSTEDGPAPYCAGNLHHLGQSETFVKWLRGSESLRRRETVKPVRLKLACIAT